MAVDPLARLLNRPGNENVAQGYVGIVAALHLGAPILQFFGAPSRRVLPPGAVSLGRARRADCVQQMAKLTHIKAPAAE
jgi:hypothetical protein